MANTSGVSSSSSSTSSLLQRKRAANSTRQEEGNEGKDNEGNLGDNEDTEDKDKQGKVGKSNSIRLENDCAHTPIAAVGTSIGNAVDIWDLLLFLVCCVHILYAPYTKVEESFYVHGVQDILRYGPFELTGFDHLVFPGVVPRSFVPSLFFAAVLTPAYWVMNNTPLVSWLSPLLSRSSASPSTASFFPASSSFSSPPSGDLVALQVSLLSLFLLRMAIALFSVLCFASFRRACSRYVVCDSSHQRYVANALVLIVATQFHLPFYFSRPLANTFSMGLLHLAVAALLDRQPRRCLFLFAFTVVVVRCDAVLVALPFLFCGLLFGWLRLQQVIVYGVQASVLSLGLTLAVDSHFWRENWMWPEWQVFAFNTLANRSHEYGVSAWHWYFSNAIPRSLLCWVILLPVGMLHPPNGSFLALFSSAKQAYFGPSSPIKVFLYSHLCRKLLSLMVPTLVFVSLYSFLPHKELRFIFPALSLLNLPIAVFAARHYASTQDRYRYHTFGLSSYRLRTVAMYLWCVVCLGAVSFFLAASALNYPGGEAVRLLNTHILAHRAGSPSSSLLTPPPPSSSFIRPKLGGAEHSVHVDNMACINGYTRFQELERSLLHYDKTEGIEEMDDLQDFSFLITTKPHVAGFRPIADVRGYGGIDISFFRSTSPSAMLKEIRKAVTEKSLQKFLRLNPVFFVLAVPFDLCEGIVNFVHRHLFVTTPLLYVLENMQVFPQAVSVQESPPTLNK